MKCKGCGMLSFRVNLESRQLQCADEQFRENGNPSQLLNRIIVGNVLCAASEETFSEQN